jgi:hypothetical protein
VTFLLVFDFKKGVWLKNVLIVAPNKTWRNKKPGKRNRLFSNGTALGVRYSSTPALHKTITSNHLEHTASLPGWLYYRRQRQIIIKWIAIKIFGAMKNRTNYSLW